MRSLLSTIAPIITFALYLSACASSKARVIQRQDGTSEVIAAAKKESDATIAAVDKASAYCRKKDLEPVFQDQAGNEQCGSEQAMKTLDTLRRIPVAGRILGSENPDDAQVLMSFTCKEG